jgi:chromosome segregation ATPase
MADEFADLTPGQHRTEARLVTLERVSDEHADKINRLRGSLDAIHTDLGEMRDHFVRQEGLLQALHLTQNEHTAALRELRTGQEELRTGQEELRQGLAETRVGVLTIIGMLRSAEDREDESGGS